MQMLKPKKGGANYAAQLDWRTAMDAEGAGQMHHLKDLMLSRPYFDRVPDQSLVAGENGRPFSVNMGKIDEDEVVASWFSPRDGGYTEIGVFPNTGVVEFTPPGTRADGNDWVLVLDTKK